MGLDMYLEKAPRYQNATIRDVQIIESYLRWSEVRNSDSEFSNCTLKEWCGVEEKDLPPKDYLDYYTSYRTTHYPSWDTKKEHGYTSIIAIVGYWRKSNQIHNWFVENIQNGVDECEPHEVSKEQFEDLLKICKSVLNEPNLASELLPTCSGFFFGSVNYDEDYYHDIEETVKIIENVLEKTDFEKEMIAYYSSW